jgi:hypothetical protein
VNGPTSWHSYPKLFAFGHRALADLLLDDVIVEEKVDGSQFSFGMFYEEANVTADTRGMLHLALKIRSKGVQMDPGAPEKMFMKAVESVRAIEHRLIPGWTYRAEFLSKPKHNTLAYDRTPKGYLAIFDINTGEEAYLPYEEKAAEAERLGLDVVPLIYRGRIASAEQLLAMLDRTSFLGGQKIEGVVVKNYARFGTDKKALMGKYVSEAFKEVHQGEWKKSNPTQTDVVQALVGRLTTPARWNKAIQHLRERGELTDSPKDIGNLIKEVQGDVMLECKDEIIAVLLKWATPTILRGIVRGLPEWYKQELLAKQFGIENHDLTGRQQFQNEQADVTALTPSAPVIV